MKVANGLKIIKKRRTKRNLPPLKGVRGMIKKKKIK
jgi:hypothetical protein